MSISRRDFLAGVASVALVGCGRKTDRPVAGGFAEDGAAEGHRIRDAVGRDAPVRRERAGVVIVGGGIAGLSAAWWLDRHGLGDFVVLELESHPGGNARWGETEAGPHPWAAHYVPVPGPGAAPLVRELMSELGVLREDGTWKETALVFDPAERLFRWGRWARGLEEALAETVAERAEFDRFHEEMQGWRETGAFTIPSAAGTPLARAEALDGLTMAAWLDGKGYRTPALRWYVDYACRDDYGAAPRDVSAWAGVHYFAGRPAEEEGPLSWPAGNGWIVRRLLERLGGRVRTGMPVRRVVLPARPAVGGAGAVRGGGVKVLAGDTEYTADAAVWAAPSFVAPYVVEGAPQVDDLVYSPWLTAAVTLDRLPRDRGADGPGRPAWDNVLFDSPSLGYVVGGHQTLATAHAGPSVWTWYTTFQDRAPAEARAMLLRRGWGDWKETILADLERAHPDIRRCVSRIDVLRLGHAMVRPMAGFRSSPARLALRETDGPVVYAHSDLSGLSLFEEAQYRGVEAAEKVLARVGGG